MIPRDWRLGSGARIRMLCLGLCTAAAALSGCAGEESEAIHCYVGGTMRPAMEELVRLYEAETGVRVELDYGDSGSNMIKAETTGRGDLCVAHDPFHGAMQNRGLSTEAWAVATVTPMIAVQKGNPKQIQGLKDLAKPGIRVILTDPMYSTVGHINTVMFRRADLAEAIAKNVVTHTRQGGEAANAVTIGNADAAIVWNAVIFLRREKLDAVDIEAPYRPDPKVDAVTSATFGHIDMSRMRVTIDLLKSSRQPEAARRFGEFVASARAWTVWQAFGFSPPPEERHLGPAAESRAGAAGGKPLFIYCGAGLRPAIDDVASTFTAKTGITVERDYAGSGMQIPRIRLTKRGDLFMPGDVWYIELAEKDGLVESKSMVCYFVPVIMVPKGNPKKVQSLKDLVGPGIRLGLGNPKSCQVGRLSEKIFAKNGIDADAVAKNLAFSSTTVNELGLQIKAGALDAAIVWDAVAAQYPDCAEVVAIPLEQNEISRVAVAVLKSSANPGGAAEFVKFLLGDEGQALFKKHHYRTAPPQQGPVER